MATSAHAVVATGQCLRYPCALAWASTGLARPVDGSLRRPWSPQGLAAPNSWVMPTRLGWGGKQLQAIEK